MYCVKDGRRLPVGMAGTWAKADREILNAIPQVQETDKETGDGKNQHGN